MDWARGSAIAPHPRLFKGQFSLLVVTRSFLRGLPQVVLVVKNLPANAGNMKSRWFDPCVGKIPWKKKWQPTSVFLPEEFHGQNSLVCYSPWVAKSWHNWNDLARIHISKKNFGFNKSLFNKADELENEIQQVNAFTFSFPNASFK